MAHMLDLPAELITTIIAFMVMSSSDVRDWARVTAVCKQFYTAAIQQKCLKLVNCEPAMELMANPEQHQHIDGLLSRCVLAENPTADSVMAKVILFGGPTLWTKLKENAESVSRMKTLSALRLSNLRMLAKSFRSDSIADAAYIVFSLEEDEPSLYEPYKRLHPLRLIKLLITHAFPFDIVSVLPLLKEFVLFFVGYPEFIKFEGIGQALENMYQHELRVWHFEGLIRNVHLAALNLSLPGCLVADIPRFRNRFILALDEKIKL